MISLKRIILLLVISLAGFFLVQGGIDLWLNGRMRAHWEAAEKRIATALFAADHPAIVAAGRSFLQRHPGQTLRLDPGTAGWEELPAALRQLQPDAVLREKDRLRIEFAVGGVEQGLAIYAEDREQPEADELLLQPGLFFYYDPFDDPPNPRKAYQYLRAKYPPGKEARP